MHWVLLTQINFQVTKHFFKLINTLQTINKTYISQWLPTTAANIIMLTSPSQFMRFMSSQMCFVCLNNFGSGSFCFMWSFCVVMCFVFLSGLFCEFRFLPRIVEEIFSYPLGLPLSMLFHHVVEAWFRNEQTNLDSRILLSMVVRISFRHLT